MATPFRRPWVSWRVVSSIGELRGCTISGNRQHAGQATAAIPRSIGDDAEECHHVPLSPSLRSISLYPIVFRGPKFGVVNLGFRYALREENGATSAVHPESPPYLIVQTKDVLKSQDADLSKS